MLCDGSLEGECLSTDGLAGLPLEIVYCLFEAFEPAALLSLALTNKTNLALLATWLDRQHILAATNGDRSIPPGTQFRFLCQKLGQVKDRRARKQAATILRRWQTRVLTEQGRLCGQELVAWNVCNGCLKFKKQHTVSCTQCPVGATCENFICQRYCIFY